MVWQIDNRDLKRLMSDLIAIDSVNPSLVRDGAGEKAIAEYILSYYRSLGLPARLDNVAPGRPNVLGMLPPHGKEAGGEDLFDIRHGLIINSHLDTVGVTGMTEPFVARFDGDKVYGRGAADCKAGIAAALLAMAEVRRQGIRLKRSVLFTGVSDEEYASIGSEDIARRYRADGAVINEPTGGAFVIAHKGFAWVTVETTGFAAHGSLYEKGIDAIAHMGRFLVEAEKLSNSYLLQEGHPLVGKRSLHASLIEGGKELSTYPDLCQARFERRTLPDEDPAIIMDEFSEISNRLSTSDPAFHARLNLDFTRRGYEVRRDEPVVLALSDAYQAITGELPEYAGASGWMDSALLGGVGIPTVIYGPAGEGAHALVEHADLSSIEACARVLAQMILRFCGE